MSSSSSSAVGRSFARSKRTILASLAAVSAAAFLVPASASAGGGTCAESTTWTGDAATTDWMTAGNWSDGLPSALDDAIINATEVLNPEVGAGDAAVACEVHLTGNKQLNVSGGSLNVTPGSQNDEIDVDAGSNVNVTGGELTFGTLRVQNTSGLTMTDGAIAGTLASTTPLTLTNASTNFGTAVSATNGVTLGGTVNVNQTGDIAIGGAHFLTIPNGRTYTLIDGADVSTLGGFLNVNSGGIFRHQGTTGATLGADIDSDGTIEDTSTAGTGLLVTSSVLVSHQLGGTLHTTNSGQIELNPFSGDTITVKSGGLTISDQSGVADSIRYSPGPNGNLLLNSQTVTLQDGDFTCDGNENGPEGGEVTGTGTFTRNTVTGGELRLKDCNFADGANVTISSVLTARAVADNSWDNTFNLNVNGTLLLDDTSVTAPIAANTPQVNISSTGTLRHTGIGTGLFEPRIVSNSGTIEDDSSGELRIQRVPAQTNLYSGTIRTLNGNADVELGTEVHRLQGALTMDSSQGGEIRTAGAADLQLNGNTLTLVGNNALEHESGTITGTGTIAGPGILRIDDGGGDFAGGGTMNVNAQTIQTSPTNVGGFGSQLRIGGDWTSDADMTSSESATVVVTSSGTLRHTTGTSTVSAPLTIEGTVDVDGGQLQLSDLSNYDGGTDTLTGGAYNIAGGGTSLCIEGELNTLAAALSISGSGALLYAPAGCATNAITDELGAIASGGTFTLVNGHTADIASPLDVNGGGELAGNGTIVGNVNNSGVVSPGLGIGQLNIDGNYNQSSFGVLEIEVQGTGVSQFDVLEVDGDISLEGELAMLPIGSFPANADGGDRVAFLRYTGTRSGTTFNDVSTNPSLAVGQPFFDDYDDPGLRVFAVVGNTFKGGANFIARRNRNNGTATLIVKVTGSGVVTVKGPEIKTKQRDADGPGKVNLPIKTRKGTDARKELNRDGETTVKVTVKFNPDIGNNSKQKITVQLIDRD